MKKPEIITYFDSSIASYNIGNRIITDAVNLFLDEMFPNDFVLALPFEDIKTNVRKYNRLSKCTFVGGTNVLNCNIRKYRQWDLSLHNIMILRNLVLCGCGWWRYEDQSVTPYTQWALHKVLSSEYMHSVRDSYTQQRLSDIGIRSINTGCPTLWQIDDDLIRSINAKNRQSNVVITVTDYDKQPSRDKLLIDACVRMYEKVYVFIQGTGDYAYINSLGEYSNLHFISPRVEAYNKVLETNKVDYVGTRLHAGIRSIQKGARTYIIAIDNRSKEMSRDFGVPILEVEELNDLEKIIDSPYKLDLRIPRENIRKWKKQFATT